MKATINSGYNMKEAKSVGLMEKLQMLSISVTEQLRSGFRTIIEYH